MPRPRYPSDDVDKLMLRFPAGLRPRLEQRAKANLRSMNSEVVMILATALGAESKETTTGVQFGDPSPAAAHEAARKGDPVTHG